MSKEELLKPRYKVIADYPRSAWRVGRIIEGYFLNDLLKSEVDMRKYPHLFKKLEWWEEITVMDLPDYIKWTSPGQNNSSSFFRVNNWYSSPNSFDIAGCDVDGGRLFIKECQPATEQEYNDYINSVKP